MSEEMLKIKELADKLHVHTSTLRRLWRAGKLPGYKLGHKTLRFKLSEALESFSAASEKVAK